MTKIKNQDAYPQDITISDLDFIIGSDGNTLSKKTKTFLLGSLRNYIQSGLSPVTGGTLKFDEITYTGGLYSTFAEVVNNLAPNVTVLQYHVVVVNFNGSRAILKLQNRLVGVGQTPVVDADFIKITPTASNVGSGAGVFKELSSNDYKFRKIKTENLGEGISVLKPEVENTNDISIIGRKLSSTTLNITESSDGNGILIEVPSTSDIPSLIVNNAYVPSARELALGFGKGRGTASKPFTDTVTAYVLGVPTITVNTAIQNALDAYKGTGGKGTIAFPSNPSLLGSIIQIEKGNLPYVFIGDSDYLDAKVLLKSGAIISSEPVGDYFMDFSNFSRSKNHNPVITIEEGAYLFIKKNGFNLVSNTGVIGTANRQSLKIEGGARGTGINLVGDSEAYKLFVINSSGGTDDNGGFYNLEINSFISTRKGVMFEIGGKGRVKGTSAGLYFLTESGITITDTYPVIKIKDNAQLYLSKCETTFNKSTLPFTYNQLVVLEGSGTFTAIDSYFQGFAKYFVKMSAGNLGTIVLDSCKNYIDTTVAGGSFADKVDVAVWQNLLLTNNNMPYTKIDPTKAEILPSAINTIGGKVVETLLRCVDRADAVSAYSVPKGGKFIKTGGVSSPTTGWVIDMVM